MVRPRSIAIVGVSAKGTGFGSVTLGELSAADFDGPIYVVSQKIDAAHLPVGVQLIGRLADLPEPVDCVLVAVAADGVEEVVKDAATARCRSAIIFSSGFGETAYGAAAEARLCELAQHTGIRIGGPNTAGILNYIDGTPLAFISDLRMDLPKGNIGIVSQSGGLATHLGHRRQRGLGVSYTITTGNSADVSALDYVNFLIDDAATRVIVLMIEGLSSAEGLAHVGRRARAAGKPLLVLKSGRTCQGNQAAISHTGSLAGSHDVFLAAAEDAGLMMFQSTELLVETAQLFSRWSGKGWVPGGVAILTTMGGPGVMAADAAEDNGLKLPAPGPATAATLRQLMPAFAATGNPIDTSAFQSDDMLRQSLEALAGDPQYSAVVMLASTTTGAATARRPYAITAAARAVETPVCAVWLSSWLEGPGSEILDSDPNIPVFRTVENCMAAIAHWQSWHAKPSDTELPICTHGLLQTQREAARALLAQAGSATMLDEVQSRTLIEVCGIRNARAEITTCADEAIRAARLLGMPVVAKIISPDIPHKAKVGGVRVGLEDEQAVANGFRTIIDEVSQQRPDAELRGVLVAEMVRGTDEFMVGVVRDPVFGPVVLCGAGGGAVEDLRDISRCLTPVTPERAERAINSICLFKRVAARDVTAAAILRDRLAAVMKNLGDLATACPRIAEIDVNPLVLTGTGDLLALDALVILRDEADDDGL